MTLVLILLTVITNFNAIADHTAPDKSYKLCKYDSPEELTVNNPDTELCSRNQQWFYFNSTTKTPHCISGTYTHITCSDSGPLLQFGYCATYSEDTGLVTVTKCPYFQAHGHMYNMTPNKYDIYLPKMLADLNDSMCGPMNRKGIVCSECIDGFGPSVTSIGYICANCTDAWYRVPLFLVLLFAPITVFYLFVLIFQISLTSPPIPCFIMYVQIYAMEEYLVNWGNFSAQIIFNNEGNIRLDIKIILTLYGLFNLDFFHYILPPFCVSSQIKPIHIAFLGYVSVLYPILLIFLTWLCVELHGCNFRPIVWLWKPFHRCCVKLRRSWNNQNDIIDVFVTFFFLSYHKCLYQFMLLLSSQSLRNYNSTVDHSTHISTYTRIAADLTVTAGSSQHIPYAVTAGIVTILFYILPTLLLMLYPIKVFRRLLSKCHLDFIALNIFVDKIHGDYKNGLNGDRDMRSLSGLYFSLRIILALSSLYPYSKRTYDVYAIGCGILLGCVLTVALLKPYKNSHMNYLDTFLLANYLLIWYIISAQLAFSIALTKLLLTLPMVIFIMGIILRKMSNTKLKNQANKIYCYLLIKAKNLISEGQQEQQPLLQPN